MASRLQTTGTSSVMTSSSGWCCRASPSHSPPAPARAGPQAARAHAAVIREAGRRRAWEATGGPGARRAREPPPPPPTGPAGGPGGPRARRRAHGEENSLALSESRGLRPSVRAALGSWLSDFCHFCCCHKNKPYIIAAPQNARTAGSFVEVHGLLTCGVATGPRPDRREEG